MIMDRRLSKFVKLFLKSSNYIINNTIFRNIHKRLQKVEYRSVNRRFFAIEQTTEYLIGAEIPGDYLEFGVFQGTTFRYAMESMSPYLPEMKYIAFDSFEGLPAPRGIDAENGYTSNFQEEAFSCSEDEFYANLKKSDIDRNKVKTVKGWFDKTLTPETAQEIQLEKIAVAWIDCDLYESTVPVLNFITPFLQVGTVIIFDDWRCYRNHPDYGEQKACREWLEQNPHISLSELYSFGWNGIAFTVSSC